MMKNLPNPLVTTLAMKIAFKNIFNPNRANTLFNCLAFLLGSTLLLTACNDGFDDTEVVKNEFHYFKNKEQLHEYSAAEVNLFLTIAAASNPELAAMKSYYTQGFTVYKITYNTTFDDQKVVASGLVSIPSEPGTYPLFSYQNGTNTLHSLAPTKAADQDIFKLLEMTAAAGFVVTVPDYLGFGESEQMIHPYLDKESTVQTVLDMLRAVKEMLEGQEVNCSNELYLAGYSQGGWASMQLQKTIEKNNNNEFHLKASACGAGPYNLMAVNKYVMGQDNYPEPYFLGYIFNTFVNTNMTTSITHILNPPFSEKITQLYDGMHSGPEINSKLTTSISELFRANYIENWESSDDFAEIRQRLETNSVSAYSTAVPTRLYHGTADELIPPSISEEMYSGFVAAGVEGKVTYVPMAGLDHIQGAQPFGLQAIKWFFELHND